jgi:hypothetical protein
MVMGDLLVTEQAAAQASTGDLAILVAPRTRRVSGHCPKSGRGHQSHLAVC